METKHYCDNVNCWQRDPCAAHGSASEESQVPSFLEMPAFSLSDGSRAWVEYFRQHGVVVLKNVLSQSEVDEAKDLYWAWLEGLGSGIKRGHRETWGDDNWPGVTRLGFVPSHGGGHNKASWYLRTRPAIQAAFAALWDVEPSELLTSFDTWILWRPWWEQETEDWQPRVERLHIDQNPFWKPGFKCVQGMMPLLPVTPVVGGLQVIPGTNTDAVQKRMVEQYVRVERNSSDWLELRHDDSYIGKGQLLRANPGDFILWDSRTVHGGFVGQGREPSPLEGKDELARMSMTICMTPAKLASDGVIEKRWGAFEKGKCLAHWPHEFHPHNMGDSAGKNIPKRPFQHEIEVTPEIARLIGKRRDPK